MVSEQDLKNVITKTQLDVLKIVLLILDIIVQRTATYYLNVILNVEMVSEQDLKNVITKTQLDVL
jgi:hypothetical protein